jgi:DNA-directed RNA polymerase subunit alpha
MVESNDFFAKFEFSPLESGFGITVGNALRRVLLSSLQGYAITQVKISGVVHEFGTIPGVIDDVTNIILNIKEVRFLHISGTDEYETVAINVTSGKEVFKAADMSNGLTNFEILNPGMVICRMDKTASFKIEFKIEKGRGYLPADENKTVSREVGIIAVDAIFTPIRNVMYTVEPERVEQKTDYDKLVLEITTDGSITPKEALREASRILIQHFIMFAEDKISSDVEAMAVADDFDDNYIYTRQLLKTKLADLDLSVRAINCLKSADVEVLADLCRITKADLLKFRNFGKKSLTELEEKLTSLNLSFGTDLTKYKLDND